MKFMHDIRDFHGSAAAIHSLPHREVIRLTSFMDNSPSKTHTWSKVRLDEGYRTGPSVQQAAGAARQG